jgi:hypothetical protein
MKSDIGCEACHVLVQIATQFKHSPDIYQMLKEFAIISLVRI